MSKAPTTIRLYRKSWNSTGFISTVWEILTATLATRQLRSTVLCLQVRGRNKRNRETATGKGRLPTSPYELFRRVASWKGVSGVGSKSFEVSLLDHADKRRSVELFELDMDLEDVESSIEDETGCKAAGAFFSSDFDWEELRETVERTRADEFCTSGGEVEVKRKLVDSNDTTWNNPPAWEVFHKTHSKALFFKERRYLVLEFPELIQRDEAITILEVGCGTGSSVTPILRVNRQATIYGCDCSPAALERAKLAVAQLLNFDAARCQRFCPFMCDVSVESFPSWLCCSLCRKTSAKAQNPFEEVCDTGGELGSADSLRHPIVFLEKPMRCLRGVNFVMLVFTLSAIPPEKMCQVLAECAAVLRPGGSVLFRDYGLYDLSMLRFPSSQRIGDRLYRRQDGTLAYFFSLEVVRDLFASVGLAEEEVRYCCVQLTNRRKEIPMKRVWVHAKFSKPSRQTHPPPLDADTERR